MPAIILPRKKVQPPHDSFCCSISTPTIPVPCGSRTMEIVKSITIVTQIDLQHAEGFNPVASSGVKTCIRSPGGLKDRQR